MSELWEKLPPSLGSEYTLERELGGGGMSLVFLSLDLALARQVVVNVLPPNAATGVSAERFNFQYPEGRF